MGNLSPNTKGIVEYKKNQSEEKKKAVLSVLKQLVALNEPISKAEICRRAGVSKTFLYSFSEELLNPINDAINYQNMKLRVSAQNNGISDGSKSMAIESLRRRIQQLEDENRRLKKENAILLGKLVK